MNSITKFLLFISCFSLQHVLATDIPAGNVSGQWTMANSPYRILGNISVTQDSLLQIDAGVSVVFQGHYVLSVLGRVHALGTSANPVTFTAVNDWWGIRFDNIPAGQDSSLFLKCIIEKGNANGSGDFAYGGGFFIAGFSKVRIEGCTINDNEATYGGGIYCDHANPLIIGNTIINNNSTSYYGGGIYCDNSSPSIINNTITSNDGQIECKFYSSPNIIGNTITSGGFGIGCEMSSNPNIINNIISYNDIGIVLVGSSANVIGNLISHNSGNSFGSGIFSYGQASPNIINNTIAYNTATQYGGGLCFNNNNSPVIKNTIVWGNSAPSGQQISLQTTTSPVFYNCDVQGGASGIYYSDAPSNFTGTYLNCIDSNPLFLNTGSNDFTLMAGSLCIDAGDTTGMIIPLTDYLGNPRICNNLIDIGACELCLTGIHENNNPFIYTSVYPIPAHNQLTFEMNAADFFGNFELEIYAVPATLLKRISIKIPKTEIALGNFPSGIYFYQLKRNSKLLSYGKFIVD